MTFFKSLGLATVVQTTAGGDLAHVIDKKAPPKW